MRSFYYRPGKNAALALFMGLAALFSARMWWSGGGFFAVAGALLFGAAALKGALNAFNHEPVLRFDRDRLWVRTTFGGVKELAWSEVQRISLEVLTIRYYGIIPMGRTEILCIACDGGAFGTRRLRISASTIQLPVGGAGELTRILQQAQLEAVGAAGVAMAGAGRRGWGVGRADEPETAQAEGFDADAAIARYLAQKEQAGRAGPAPAARPNLPQAPVFGRRVSSS